MPAVLAVIARQIVLFAITYVAAEVAQKTIAPVVKNTVDATAAHFGIPETDAKIVVANSIIDNAVAIGAGALALKSRLPLVAADYLGLTASGFKKQALSKVAAEAVAKDASTPTTIAAAKSTIGKYFSGENIWKVVITLMGIQQVGDWFIFGKPQLQGYLDAALGKGTVKLPSAPAGPAPFSQGEWTAYITGLENAGIVGIEGGAVGATLLYTRDALVQLAWWAYGEQLKKGVNPTVANVKPIIFPHLRFAGAPAPVATSSAAAGKPASTAAASATGTGASGSGSSTLARESVSSTVGGADFIAPATAYIDNASELQTQALTAARAFFASIASDLVLEINSVTRYTDDSGRTHYAGVAQVQTGVDSKKQPKYKKYTGHFAVLSVYYDIPGPSRVKLMDIPLGSLNVSAYRPDQNDLATIADAVSAGVAAFNFGGSGGGSSGFAAPAQVTVAAGANSVTSGGGSGGGDGTAAAPVVTGAIPLTPTQAQIDARNNPTPVSVALPVEGQIYRVVGDDTQGVVYQVVAGVPQRISADTLVANTDLSFPDGSLWRQGQPLPAGENPRDSKPVSNTFTGGYWSHIYDRAAWDTTHGAGSWAALPAFNQADITTVMSKTDGKLPGSASYTLNG